jgi:predicted component of type VI protein secretion system
MNSQFDPIDYSHELQTVGVSQQQAEMHAKLLPQALTNCAASRADLNSLGQTLTAGMTAFEERISARLDLFETRMDAFETKVTAGLNLFEARMDAFETQVTARLNLFEARMDAFETMVTARLNLFEARMNAFETQVTARIDALEARIDLALEQMRGEQKQLRWMCATNTAMLIAVIVKIYFP